MKLVDQFALQFRYTIRNLLGGTGRDIAGRMLVPDDLRAKVLLAGFVDVAHVDIARPRILHFLDTGLRIVLVPTLGQSTWTHK